MRILQRAVKKIPHNLPANRLGTARSNIFAEYRLQLNFVQAILFPVNPVLSAVEEGIFSLCHFGQSVILSVYQVKIGHHRQYIRVCFHQITQFRNLGWLPDVILVSQKDHIAGTHGNTFAEILNKSQIHFILMDPQIHAPVPVLLQNCQGVIPRSVIADHDLIR